MKCRLTPSLLLGVIPFFILGCAPSRNAYYDDMYERRERRYENWRGGMEEEHAPLVEGELSPEEAVRLALQHSPMVAAANRMREEGRGRVVESYSAAMPRVNFNASYTRLDEVSGANSGGASFGAGDLDNYNVGLEITQPVYRAAASVARRGAKLYSYLTEEAVRETVENTIFQVTRAYYSALLADRLVTVEEAALKSARAQLEAARERYREGLAREYDVLRAQVEVSTMEAGLIEQKNEKRTSFTELMRTMGVSQKSEVTLTGELEPADFEPPSFEGAVRIAFRNRPELLQSTIEVDMAKEELVEVRTRYYPVLDFFFQHEWSKPGSQFGGSGWDDEWRSGLRLSWPIFDGLAREGSLIQKEAQLERRRILLNDFEQKAIKEVKDALLEIESSEKMVESQKLNMRRAEETERLVAEGYQEGINTEIELLDSRSAVKQSRGLYYKAVYRLRMAILNFRRSLGKMAEE